MRDVELWISSVPAPRKERVLPVSDPASATDRFEQVVAKRFTGNQKELRDDGRPAYARLCLRVGPLEVHAFGRLEWRPPVKEAHRSLRNRFQKRRGFGDGKRTVNACTPRTQHGIWNIT
jgi:hypothetical protein